MLAKNRLSALGRDLDVALPSGTKDAQVEALLGSGRVRFRELLHRLKRDELRAACRAHGLDDSGRARQVLSARLLVGRAGAESAPPASLFSAAEVARFVPRVGDVVQARHRQWLVEAVDTPSEPDELTRVRLVCLDDDAQGRVAELLWELELGARVHRPEAHGLGQVERLDPPRHFAAYLHALKWGAVTATDGRLFQSPFRAGIHLQAHQLTPLAKALSLPRANLFIADDVGIGKTIEAGLVLSELSLRQRVDFALIICPASVCLQWRDEMASRFGLQFEVMTRAFVAQRRKERGFGVNPWMTHQRIIVSHSLVRRPEYRDPLLAMLGERARKSLLILDEAHVAAPSTSPKYAVDSAITRVMRDIAPRFESRLFLSATPHNGHSNSFSALLEILDPQRFTRGVPVTSREQLAPVMVRRLKQDLRRAGLESSALRFPERRVVQLRLSHDAGHWFVYPRIHEPARARQSEATPRDLGPAEPHELILASDLQRYTELMAPQTGQGRLVFINLQKRLLSSVEAFARTLRAHARALEAHDTGALRAPAASSGEDDPHGVDDDTLDLEAEAAVAHQSRKLAAPMAEARALLECMLQRAERARLVPDAKVRAVVQWIAEHQCAGARLGGPGSDRPRARDAKHAQWSARRLIIFTEYGDTKRYLLHVLSAAIAGTERAEERIAQLHGGMSDERRQDVQVAFNGDPSRHPVRILIATDAAREGINLQAHCSNLVHFDLPWNPSRIEQRNGRIDRTLQPKESVNCRYFNYAARAEDRVLETLVRKVDVIRTELGSLGNVVMDRLEASLEARGIDAGSAEAIAHAAQAPEAQASQAELESVRASDAQLRAEIEDAAEILEASRRVLEFDPRLLRDALDVGFELAGAGRLQPEGECDGVAAYRVPELGESWQRTLDGLRPPRKQDEELWQWRRTAPRPVTFEPPAAMSADSVQLHLQHPLVQRVMSRFLSQGYGTQDLSRVTVLQNRRDALVRVIAFGRLSLFGRGATRLHDALVSVAARWVEGKPLRPFAEEGDRKAVDLLESILAEAPRLEKIPSAVQARVRDAAPALFAQLWKPVREEADARAMAAIEKLKERGRQEADALRELLDRQREAIERRLAEAEPAQLTLPGLSFEEQRQLDADRKHMQGRLTALQRERSEQPDEIEALYEVALNRLSPVGLVVLWPEVRS